MKIPLNVKILILSSVLVFTSINHFVIPPILANSFDGINWIKYADENGVKIVVDVGSSGDLDHPWAFSMGVIRDDDVLTDDDPANDDELYKIWYSGNSLSQYYAFRLFYATSSDGRNWNKYVDGAGSAIPVINLGGAPGGADDASAYSPCVIKEGGIYKMWYGSQRTRTGSYRTSYATSTDGISWTKHGEVLDVGASGERDERDAYAPQVIIDDDAPLSERYKMWYMGQTQSGPLKIFYATSSDGITWTKYSDSNGAIPVLEPGSAPGGLDDSSVGHQSLVKDSDGLYKMWYNGASSIGQRILYAESSDGITWTKHGLSLDVGNPGELDSISVGAPSVLIDADGTYKMWNHGYDGNHLRIFHAYSEQYENIPPVADVGDWIINEGEQVTIDGSASYDPDGTIETYEWDFESDGIYDYLETSSNASDGAFDGMTTHIYGDNGVYIVTLRVTDDSSESDTDSCDITVNNVEPTINAFGPFSANEGSQLNIQGTATDLGSDDITFTWDWGDGTSPVINLYYNSGTGPEPVYNPSTNEVKSPLGTYPISATDSVSHIYGDDGVYTVILTVSDDDGGETSYETTVTVNNVAPVITLMITYPDDEGSQVTLEAEAIDLGSDDLTYSWELEYGPTIENIYYNNGVDPEPFFDPITNEVKSPTGTYPFHTSDVVTHIYGDDYEYTIILTVTDDDGGEITCTSTVAVSNLAPSIIGINIPSEIDEGSSAVFEAQAEDQGSDGLTFNWEFELGPSITNVYYNDGVNPDPSPSPWGDYPFDVTDTVEHTFGDNGNFYIVLSITDDDGGMITYNTSIRVDNIAPSVDITGALIVDENSPADLQAHGTDPGSDDLTFIWEIDYGPTITNVYYNNGISPDLYPSPENNPMGIMDYMTHTWGDNGIFMVILTVTDDDGGTTITQVNITVDNVVPIVNSGGPYEIDENSPITLIAICSDPGSDDLTITWDWGDGFSSTITTIHFNNDIGPDPFPSPDINPISVTESQSHTYGDNGVFSVTITVVDDDGGITISSVNVTVNNIAPTIGDLEVYMYANISLRVAGEKYHSVSIHLFEDGSEIWTASVTRYPGNPDEQKATISNVRLDMTKSYTALVDYLPNDPRENGNVWGGNPVWIDMTFRDGSTKRLHHTFNVRKSYWNDDHWNHIDPWEVDLNTHLKGHSFEVTSYITDPGSDDETFTYTYGSQVKTIKYLNDPPDPDPYPSPQINPVDIVYTTTLIYEGPGTLSFVVEDDDGGIDSHTIVIS